MTIRLAHFKLSWLNLLLVVYFVFSSRRRHTRCYRDWSSACALPISLPESRGCFQEAPGASTGAMMPGPTKITLDQASFKALASDVRVGILKVLDERRQTVTDLSNLMGLSKPTLLDHLEKLQNAGLVKRIDEGRKWIYYELTDKGKKILHPERVSIVVALSSAAALAAVGMFYMLGGIAGAHPE